MEKMVDRTTTDNGDVISYFEGAETCTIVDTRGGEARFLHPPKRDGYQTYVALLPADAQERPAGIEPIK